MSYWIQASKLMKVIFRVDSSLKIGTGHVMRCLALAQVLKEHDVNVEFICRKHKESLIGKIRLSGFFVHELRVCKEVYFDNKLAHSHWLGATQQQDTDDCIDILKMENAHWLIVDHYGLDEKWEKSIKPYCENLMVIDDLSFYSSRKKKLRKICTDNLNEFYVISVTTCLLIWCSEAQE